MIPLSPLAKLKHENPAEYLLRYWIAEEQARQYLYRQKEWQEMLATLEASDEEYAQGQADFLRYVAAALEQEGIVEIQRQHTDEADALLQQLEEAHKFESSPDGNSIYQGLYHSLLPAIVELRAKMEDKQAGEVYTCLNAIHLVYKLKLTQRPVSPETLEAVQKFSLMLKVLGEMILKRETKE